jgi:hypothetical protein
MLPAVTACCCCVGAAWGDEHDAFKELATTVGESDTSLLVVGVPISNSETYPVNSKLSVSGAICSIRAQFEMRGLCAAAWVTTSVAELNPVIAPYSVAALFLLARGHHSVCSKGMRHTHQRLPQPRSPLLVLLLLL